MCNNTIPNEGELMSRFSHLLGDFSTLSKPTEDNNTSDSDDPFEIIKGSKNITFGRSKSNYEDIFHLLPETPMKPYTKRKDNRSKNSSLPKSSKKHAEKSILYKSNDKHDSKLKTLLKPYNKVDVTPQTRENSLKDSFSSLSIEELQYTKNNSEVSTFYENCTDFNNISYRPTPSDRHISEDLSVISKKSFSVGPTKTTTFSSSKMYRKYSKSRPKSRGGTFSKDISQTEASSLANNNFQHSSKSSHVKENSLKYKHNNSTIEGPSVTLKYKTNSLRFCNNSKYSSSCNSSTISKLNINTNSDKMSACNNSSFNVRPSHISISPKSTVKTSLNKFQNTTGCQSLVKDPKYTSEASLPTGKNNSCSSLSGIKNLTRSNDINLMPKFTKKDVNIQLCAIENIDDDDLPCTQPISSVILHGVVAYVEIRIGREYRNEGTNAELESLGAKIEKNLTKKVTHCFFYEGKMSTYRKAIEWKIPIVSLAWIEACKAELHKVPVEDFKPHGIKKYKKALTLYKSKPKIKQPVTDSKVFHTLWRRQNERDNAKQIPDSNFQQPLPGKSEEAEKIIDTLHSVAGDFRKATHQFEQILTSPILQNRGTHPNTNKPDASKEQESASKKKRNIKLVFTSSSKCNGPMNKSNNDGNSVINDENESSVQEIRVSYDSDDLLVYAKKQASTVRSSAPARLLTHRKCKKLLSSCHKLRTSGEKKSDDPDSGKKSKTRLLVNKRSDISKSTQNKNGLGNEPKSRKRKLLLPNQVMSTFEQDSGDSTSDITPVCPYKVSPNKKQKTTAEARSKNNRPWNAAPPVLSDWDSDDSLTRAARRESSALFVKKQKKPISQRYIPTIVCTSLLRNDVEVVASIVANLGKFTVEGSVSENTTHVVTCSPRRTINLLKGIARGCWILNVQWVYESLEVGKWLPEERFELIEFSPSVKQARVERQAFGPEFCLELFQGLGRIYVCRKTVPPYSDLTELIRLCGGIVVSSARTANIVIGSSVPFSPTGRKPLMVLERWVLDCITTLSQLSPYEYMVPDSEI